MKTASSSGLGLGLLTLLLLTSGQQQPVMARPPLSARIGSVFLEGDSHSHLYTTLHRDFQRAVEHLNANEAILNETRVDADIQYVKNTDQFDGYQKVCREMEYNVMAIFGSSTPEVSSSVASVCSALHIPFFNVDPTVAPVSKAYMVQLAPSAYEVSSALSDVAFQLEWTEVAVIAHKTSGSLESRTILEQLQSQGVGVHWLELSRTDIRADLVELRNRGISRFIVDVGAKLVDAFFEQAIKAGIVRSGATFLLSDLDFLSIPMRDVTKSGATILGLSLVDKNAIEEKVNAGAIDKDLGNFLLGSYRSALLFDAVHLFGLALEAVSEKIDIKNPNVKCADPEAPYALGKDILEAIVEVGESSPLKYRAITTTAWSESGLRFRRRSDSSRGLQRTNLKLDVHKMEHDTGDRIKVGEWLSSELPQQRLRLERDVVMESPKAAQFKRMKKIHVGGYLTKTPMLTVSASSGEPSGFLYDLMKRLAADLHVDFDLKLYDDKGRIDPQTKDWTGLMQALVQGNVSLGLADLTVTPERSAAVQFSVPYDTSTLTILVKRSNVKPSMSPVSFLEPFSVQMWLSILLAFVLTSLVLFLVTRLSPYERRAGQAISSISNAFWFTLTGFFLGKSDANLQPKSLSARVLTFFWWFFCLVILLTYLLSLNAHLFKSGSLDEPRNSLSELIDDPETRFAVVQGMATDKFISTSSVPAFEAIASRIDRQLNIKTISDGVQSVLEDEGKLAFLVESRQAELVLMEHGCELAPIEDPVFAPLEKFYALAFPKGSPWEQAVSKWILEYREDGTLASLRDKWFKSKQEAMCSQEGDDGQEMKSSLKAAPFSGPFLLLLLAGIGSLAVAVLELLFYSVHTASKSRKATLPPGSPGSRNRKITACSVIKQEFHEALHCSTSRSSPAQPVESQDSTPTHLRNGSNTNGSTAGNGFRFADTASNGGSNSSSPYKTNGSYYHQQTQALLRKEAALSEDANSQL